MSKAVTGEIEAFGLNVALATLNPDMFRGEFVSEEEAKYLLALNHALASWCSTLGQK